MPGRIRRLEADREIAPRLAWLEIVSLALADALDDLDPPLQRVVDLCVPNHADLCAIEIGAADGRPHLLAARHTDGPILRLPPGWSPLADGVRLGSAPLLGAGQPGERAAFRQLRASMGAASLIWAPVATERGTVGALVLATGAGRPPLSPADLQMARDLAIRVATAAERVRLYNESVARARSQATLADGLRRLGSVAAALAGAVTPAAVLRTACTDACAIFDAEAVAACWASSPLALVGTADRADAQRALDAALSGQPDPPGWVTAPMSRTEGQRGALAVRAPGGLSDEQQLMLTSLAAVIPVALERAVTTEAWHKHEAQLEAVLNAAPVAIVTVRPDGSVASANPQGRQVFGWRPGATDLQFADDVRPAMVQVARDALDRGSVTDRPVSSGNLDLLVAAVPFHVTPGVEPSILVVATDLGEERRVERVLLQAQRLEAMGQVAGGVAHDFNNLLTVMIGYTSLLRRRLAGRQGLDELYQLEIAVNRAADLTRKLLGFARRQLDEPVVVDLAATTRQLHELLQTVAGPDVTVELDAPHSEVPILADPATVEQMVLNLSINARDAMDGRGRLSIAVDTVNLDSARAAKLGLALGAYARLAVADDGPGMTEEVLARCLEPFFSTKERGKGSGLGLSTVYGQAVGYGGTLTIHTAVGQGTTVEVWLPVSRKGPVHAEPAVRPAPSQLSGRVLLVDDQDDLRRLAVEALADAGLDVSDAGSAEAALEWAEQPWDLLVTDIVLPGLSGVELATRVRTVQPQLPVLFVSGYADSQTRRWGMVEGSHLLRKPYGPDVLCQRVGDLLRYGSKR